MTNQHKEYKQAVTGMQDMVESTNQLIDMHFTQFAEFLEDKNIGVLKAYRTLMERNLDQADLLAKNLVESKVSTFNMEERVKVGSIFGAISKIVDRIGYIDYLIKARRIDK